MLLVTGMKRAGVARSRGIVRGAGGVRGGEYGATVRDGGIRKQTRSGRPLLLNGPRGRVSRWPPLRLARMRFERESVGVVLPADCFTEPIDRGGGSYDAPMLWLGCASRVRAGGALAGRCGP